MEHCLILDSAGVDNEWMVLNQALHGYNHWNETPDH